MVEKVIHDEILGTLTWNNSLDWWEGQAELSPGRLVRISLSVDDEKAGDEVAGEATDREPARRALVRLQEHEPEARIAAADELLEIYNTEWNDVAPLDEDEFTARLTLNDVSLSFNGSAELFYDDGGLFGGHAVLVTMAANGNFTDADIAG